MVLDEAFYVFDTMHERTRLPASLYLYKTLFYGFYRHERIEEAELLVGEMESEVLSLGFSKFSDLRDINLAVRTCKTNKTPTVVCRSPLRGLSQTKK